MLRLQHHRFSTMRLECVGMHPIYIHPHPLSPPASPNLNSNNNNNSNSLNTGSAKNVEPQSSSFSRRGGREISYSQPRNGSRASRGSWWNYDGSLRHPIISNNNTSALSSEQANAATRIANASFQAVKNTNLNANPPGAVGGCLCSHCSTLGMARVPQRPCKYCDVMGHIGINCPEVVEVCAQKATGDLAPV